MARGSRAMADSGRRGAASPRPFDLNRLARVVLMILAAGAVLYLVAANALLRTRLLRDLVSEGPDVELEYTSAYSVWPGRVHVRELALEVQDYDLQLAVAADSALVEVSLHDLLFRRFHADRVSLLGLSFRLRHKVDPVDAERPWVAAYPSIRGFADPPLHVGERPPPTPDEEYRLWQIALDDVQAELRELWMLEYRYVGAGNLRGGFVLQPGRHFEVFPARVELAHGELSVGDEVAAARLNLGLDARIAFTDVRENPGAAFVDGIFGQVALDASGLDLAALDAHASARGSWRVAGTGSLEIKGEVRHGRLEPKSSLALEVPDFALMTPLGRLSGTVSSELVAAADGRLDWQTRSPKLSLANAARQAGPVIAGAQLMVGLHSDSLADTPSLRRVELDVPQLVVPSLQWTERWSRRAGIPVEAAGRLEGSAHVTLVPSRGPEARVRLRLTGAELSADGARAGLQGRIDAELQPLPGKRAVSGGRVDLELDGVEVGGQRERTKPFRTAIRTRDLVLSLDPEPAFSANVGVSADPADSLLSLALGSSLVKELVADVFDLKRLTLRARVDVNKGAVRVELARAESGALTGTGYWQRPAAGNPSGAFLISNKVANVGIALRGSNTETAWFVPDDWLSRGRPEANAGGASATWASPGASPTGASGAGAPGR